MNYWLWLACIEEISSVKKLKLLWQYKSPEKIFHLSREEIVSAIGIEEKEWHSIKNSKDILKVNRIEDGMKKYHIGQINIFDQEYPEKLKNIYDPPITLFYLGKKELLKEECIGLVGSRIPSPYGNETAKKMAEELARQNITVISGLAKGIDAAALKGALNVGGNTIGVIGSGLDIVYPKENITLYQEIAKKGLIVTEYILGAKPLPEHFPARNRIISGLSNGVIVVEASRKSGALITADFALNQGKNVYAVPGNVNSFQSAGTNMLIKEGAILYTGIQDLE